MHKQDSRHKPYILVALALCWLVWSSGSVLASSSTPLASYSRHHNYNQPQLLNNMVAARVLTITDGDTIRVEYGGENLPVRYIGMDTPELEQNLFVEAKELNRSFVEGQTVYLEKDVSETDRYGRLLRYVWLADGRMVNRELVLAGLALSATYQPDVKYQDWFLAAQQNARTRGRGMWGEAITSAGSASEPITSPNRIAPSCNRSSNLRSGPGTNYTIAGSCSPGGRLAIDGRNQAGDWLQLTNGKWIAAFLVNNIPPGLSVVAGQYAAPQAIAMPQRSAQASAGNCDPSYPTVCIPRTSRDLDCPDIGFRRFQVVGADPHNFDGDFDGIGCEGG